MASTLNYWVLEASLHHSSDFDDYIHRYRHPFRRILIRTNSSQSPSLRVYLRTRFKLYREHLPKLEIHGKRKLGFDLRAFMRYLRHL